MSKIRIDRRRRGALSGRWQEMPLLEVLQELAQLYPALMLDDLTKPGEGPFAVRDVLEGIRFSLEHKGLPVELRSFLQLDHWMWAMDDLGFVQIWAMPEGGPLAFAFREHESGLPVGRPPFTK